MQGVPTMYAAILNHPSRRHGRLEPAHLRPAALRCRSRSCAPSRTSSAAHDPRGVRPVRDLPRRVVQHADDGAQAGHHRRGHPRLKCVDLEGQEVPVGEVGEIAIRGDNVMKGYWNKPEATAEAIPDGWFRTGDLATMDEEGYFTSSTARRT